MVKSISKITRLFFIFSISFFSMTAFSLTLEDAYKRALKISETLPSAESKVREKKAALEESRSAFRPSFAASASYLRQDKDITSLSEKDQLTTKVTASHSLYAGGRDQAQFESSEKTLQAENQGLLNTRRKLFQEVAEKYYSLLSAQRELENTRTSISLTKQRLNELEKRKRIGKSRDIEVLAAQSQQSVLEAQALSSESQARIAADELNKLTGLTSETDLEFPAQFKPALQPLQFYLDKIPQRPDIRELELKVESLESENRATERRVWPSLDFAANYYPYRARSPQSASSTTVDWDVGLVLTVPLWDGGSNSNQATQIFEQKVQAELLVKQRFRESEQEIRRAYNSVRSSMDQIKALEKAVTITEKNYRQQEKDYRFSLATNLDVIQALNSLHETKRNWERTRFQALQAWADLQVAAQQQEF